MEAALHDGKGSWQTNASAEEFQKDHNYHIDLGGRQKKPRTDQPKMTMTVTICPMPRQLSPNCGASMPVMCL